MGTFARSKALTKSSWRVLKAEKKIIRYEAIAAGIMLVVGLLFGVLGSVSGSFAITDSGSSSQMSGSAWYWPLLAMYLLVGSLVTTFIGAAICNVVIARFEGKPLTYKQGLSKAWEKRRPLASFAAVNATVGFLFQMLQEKLPFGGKIAALIGDVAWSVASVFAVPAIALSKEDLTPLAAVKQSTAVLKSTWKENIVANTGVGIVGGLVVLLIILFSVGINILLAMSAPVFLTVGIPLAIALMVISLLVLSAMSDILKAALWYFATTGRAPEEFDRELLHAAFRPKKKMFR